MEEKLYTDAQLKNIIDNEGLDYAVQYYLNSNKVENEVTRILWEKAKLALDNLRDHLALDD